MKRTPLRKKSDKKKIRDRLGSLHLKLLRSQRGEVCQICGRVSSNLGRFHILPVGKYPKLEFVSENVLLACWHPCHFSWHHSSILDERNKNTLARIKLICGDDFEDKLNAQNELSGKIDLAMVELWLNREVLNANRIQPYEGREE